MLDGFQWLIQDWWVTHCSHTTLVTYWWGTCSFHRVMRAGESQLWDLWPDHSSNQESFIKSSSMPEMQMVGISLVIVFSNTQVSVVFVVVVVAVVFCWFDGLCIHDSFVCYFFTLYLGKSLLVLYFFFNFSFYLVLFSFVCFFLSFFVCF